MLKFLYIFREYRESNQRLDQIAESLGVQIEEKLLENESEALEIVEQANESGVDAIICRGHVEQCFRKIETSYRIPIVPVQFLGSSTVSLLADIKKKYPEAFKSSPTRAVVFSHRPVILDIETIRYLFDVELHNVVIEQSEKKDIEKIIKQIKQEGTDFAIAGLSICKIAKKLGFPAYYSTVGGEYESIYRTVQQAIMLVENLTIQKERSDMLESIMDYSFEALIHLDTEGKILFGNSIAEEILQKKKNLFQGQYIWEEIQELNQDLIQHVLSGDSTIYGNVIHIKERVALMNVTPYRKNGQVNGAIVHLSQKEKLEILEGQMRKELYSKGLIAKYHFEDIIGKSKSIEECRYNAGQFAGYNANVLILGESGTGKELFAQSIHNNSTRKHQPFVAINCGALPMSLLESELFGYVGGAFTGASKQGKKGLLELADKGTIFLDEISELDLQGQVRLLRVIEERVISKVGDDRVIPVDVRIIAASNRNLRELVMEGKFREDLYYRLNVLTLHIPPLRKRGMDIRILAEMFLEKYGKSVCKKLELTSMAWEIMQNYSWPGNVRQLRNFCERLVIISNQKRIDHVMILKQLEEVYQEDPASITKVEEKEEAFVGKKKSFSGSGKEYAEYQEIQEILRKCGGNRTEAAAMLGIGRTSLWRKMKKYQLDE